MRRPVHPADRYAAAGAQQPMPARAVLLLVTAVWGSTFVVIHATVAQVPPFVLVAVRFALAWLAIRLLSRRARHCRDALALALANFLGFALQTLGLQTTTPSRSAFLTALSVVLVPLLYPVFGRRLPGPRAFLGVGLAVLGVYALFRPIGLEWRSGDTLTVLAAAAFAFYIVELGRLARGADVASLVLTQCAVAALAGALAAPLCGALRVPASAAVLGGLVYLGFACTALTFSLMAWAQARVEPVQAALIYTLEPVFAALVSVAIGREPLTGRLLVGGVLITIAMLVAGGGPGEPAGKEPGRDPVALASVPAED